MEFRDDAGLRRDVSELKDTVRGLVELMAATLPVSNMAPVLS